MRIRAACALCFGLSVFALGQSPSVAEEPGATAARQHPEYLLVRTGTLSAEEAEKLPLVLRRELSADARAPQGQVVRWLDLRGVEIPAHGSVPPGGVRLLAIAPGQYNLPLRTGAHAMVALGMSAGSESGTIKGRAAPSRSLPRALLPRILKDKGRPGEEDGEGEELLRFVVTGPGEALPSDATILSVNARGGYVDSLRNVPLLSVDCDAAGVASSLGCAATPFFRIASDLADRNHPATSGQALLGEVGGAVRLRLGASDTLTIPIGAPEELEPNGPGRYHIKLRAMVLRTFKGGPPAVGASDEEAQSILREEIASAGRMWGQCGFHLGEPTQSEVEVVDPPEITMITVGCGRALPASGGSIQFRANGRDVLVRTRAGETPSAVAPRLAQAVRRVGLSAKLYRNARDGQAALVSMDLVLTEGDGRPASITFAERGLSDDPTLSVCSVDLDLDNGLAHFDDFNAAVGTPEERYLLRALSDDDPSTIELIVVPTFSGMGRIGESFIHNRGGSLENALILDRTGIRAGTRSFTLAHELGHILLDLPGHPDDFGVDTPTSLMDADAADATIFGPRRLSLEDCRRALRQSGRDSPVAMITDWPLSLGARLP